MPRKPIELPNGRKLVTLKDAATYITGLPKKESAMPEWQMAIEVLMLCSRGGDPLMAKIGVTKALHRDVVREFNSDRKETRWGKRKLKRISSRRQYYPQQIHSTANAGNPTVVVTCCASQARKSSSQKEPAIGDGSQSGRKRQQSKSIRGSVMCRNSHRTREIPRIARHGTEAPPLSCLICSQPCGAGVKAGKPRGAPPIETTPTGLGCGAIPLRTTPDSRLRARLFGMEEVISGAIAFCSESTFAMSVEI
jgi:hypothetical protein